MRPAPPTDGHSPGVTTEIVFDYPDPSLSQAPWWKSLQDLEITGNAQRAGTENVHWISGIGHQLTTIHDDISAVHEEDAGADVLKDISTGLGTFQSAPLKAIPTLTGVPVGTQVEGDRFNQKQVTAGDDWGGSGYGLSADLSSYPKPVEKEIVPLDRVYVDPHPMRPDSTVVLRMRVPHLGGAAALGAIARVYFTGLASSPNDQPEGTGQYSAMFRADGQAFLREKDIDGNWRLRRTFQWSPRNQVAGRWHFISIRSDAYMGDDGLWHGSCIVFEFQATQNFSQTLGRVGGGIVVSSDTTQYVVPQTKPQNITQVPMRLDVRQDVRARISLSYTKFAETGTLQTQTFHNPRKMGAIGTTDPPIAITVTGIVPAGTSLSIELFGHDGTPCSVSSEPGGSGQTSEQVWQSFERLADEQEYYAIITFNANATQSLSPFVRRLDISRRGVIADGITTPWTLPTTAVTDYSILGPGLDPRLENASIGLISLMDGFTVAGNGVDDPLATLKARSGQSCRISFKGLPSTIVNGVAQTTSTIFLGKRDKLKRRRLGVKRWSPMMKAGASAVQAFPSRTWWQGKMILNGLWKRLCQAKTTQTWNFGDKDPETNNIYTVTKIARLILSNMGLPSTMVDIAELPITLQADTGDKNSAFQLEVFSEAFAWVLQLLHDYLGASLVIDANATNGGGPTDLDGCIRVKLPPRPDENGKYLPLAQFVEDATWTSGLKSKMNLRSYPRYTRADSVQIPVAPVIGGTLWDDDEPPEGNCVYVTGTVASKSGGAFQQVSGSEQLWAIIHNWPAAYFFDHQPTGDPMADVQMPADPTHPDFTDGSPNLIVVIDPSLNTQGAVNLCARRTADLCMHKRDTRTFDAPVVLVVDPLDTLQIRPRPLRWGDCVFYGEEAWFVDSVIIDTNGERGGTRNGSATYKLFRIPVLMEVQDGVDSIYQDSQLYGPTASMAA